jgi:PAS domain S-box-containing protein
MTKAGAGAIVGLENDILEEDPDELYEHAPCGYLSTLPDGTIVRLNQTFLAWTGHAREQLLKRRRFQDLLTVPGKIFYDTHFGPLVQMQGFVREVAFDILRAEGEPLSALVNCMVRADASGKPALLRITVFDATDRRQYERELLLARRQAERATEAERAAREQAEAVSRVKDEFLAMISHELRTPLNAILGWAQLLRGSNSGDPDLDEGLAVIERNARVQAQLVDDLLDMGRIISGKLRLDVQPVELAGAVEAALETARHAAEAKEIRLQRVLDPTVIVSGDPGRLQQVFWNLFSNAVKFTPRGGFIRVAMERVNSHVEVSVSDSGQGMTTEFIAHAFERFRQADSPNARKAMGLGLGLSIVKHLVEMHGGSVQARSDGPGKGSTFVVHLPLTVVHKEGEAAPARVHPRAALADAGFALPEVSLAGVKVLVVDDQRDARDLVRRVLRDAGAEVSTAGSVAEAIASVETFGPDVIVSDIGMPAEDGYELIRQVRMLGGGLGGTKAVALTAFARLEDRTRAMLAGYQMHLAKPVDARELIVTVASLVGRTSAEPPPNAPA